MKRTYMVVFERVADDNWGGWAPDVGGAVGAGDTVDEARQSLREGIGYMLADHLERGLPFPDAASTSVDFSGFDPNPELSHYEIEWLTVDLPSSQSHPESAASQAA